MNAADAALTVSESARRKMNWNYDSLECAALTAVADAFEEFARILQLSGLE
jgi:hypothetical protein